MCADIRAATNQAPPLVGHNVVTSDRALVESVARHGSEAVVADLADLGALAGSAQAREHGMAANRHGPRLLSYDRYGNRADEVEFHPSWHWLMSVASASGCRRRRGPPTRRTLTCAGPRDSWPGRRWSRGTVARSP